MSTLTDNSDDNITLVANLAYDLYTPTGKEQNLYPVRDLTIAQAILEGGLRNSPPSSLALKYNNLFGIKGIGTAGQVSLPTKEYINGEWITENQGFAWNVSVEDSLQQHKEFLEHPRYTKVLAASSFSQAATEVWKAGYATDPNYPQELIDVYNEYIR